MEQAELNYYINALQKRMTDYFTQSVVLESKIAYQNDIISKQNAMIEDLNRSIEDYQSQIAHFDAQKNTTTRKKKSTPTPVNESDGGVF